MAEPVSPVFESNPGNQKILGSGETGAMPLPVYPWKNEFCSFVVSKWKLSPEELEEVNRTKCVFAVVLGERHPAIQIQGKMELVDGEPCNMLPRDPLEDLASSS